MAAPKYLISRVADPIFAFAVGTSAAVVRIRREHKESHPNESDSISSLLKVGSQRAQLSWKEWRGEEVSLAQK